MSNDTTLPDNKKLTVIFRIEPGCLGPKGGELVEGFCQYADKNFKLIQSSFVNWQIIPRFDKSQEEIQYQINNKTLTQDKVIKYLSMFDSNLDDFEEIIHNTLSDQIDQYLGHS